MDPDRHSSPLRQESPDGTAGETTGVPVYDKANQRNVTDSNPSVFFWGGG